MIQAPEKRACSDISFRLIEKSEPDLLYFPFDRKTWKCLAFAHRMDAERILAVPPLPNAASRELPSSANVVRQLRFLLQNKIQLDNRVFEAFDEKWFNDALSDAKLMLEGQKPEKAGVMVPLINIYGVSLFMQNAEANISANCPVPARMDVKSAGQIESLYAPDKSWYSEPAEQVLRRGEMCFQRKKVFRQSDHNQLSPQEQVIFALDLDIKTGRPASLPKPDQPRQYLKWFGNMVRWFIPK